MSDYIILNIGVCSALTKLTEIIVVLALKPVHLILIFKGFHTVKLMFEALIFQKSVGYHISNPIK